MIKGSQGSQGSAVTGTGGHARTGLVLLVALLVAAGVWFALADAGAGGRAALPGDPSSPVESIAAEELDSPAVEASYGRAEPEGPEPTAAAPAEAGPSEDEPLANLSLTGRVVDEFGLGVPGQRVLLSIGAGEVLEQGAAEDGSFRFGELAPSAAVLELDPGRLPEGTLPPAPAVWSPGTGPVPLALASGLHLAAGLHVELPTPGPVELRIVRAATIEGYVLRAGGAPVERAIVRVIHPVIPGSQGITDARGYYTIDDLYPGDYEIRIGDLNASDRDLARPRPTPFHLLEGELLRVPDLVLGAGSCGVTGRVVDGDGQPISGLPVASFYGEWRAGSNSERDPAGRTSTDAEGRYTIEGMLPGPAHVHAGFGRKAFISRPESVTLVSAQTISVPDLVLDRRGGFNPGGR